MKVVIIKYNAGNIRSVSFALDRAGVSAVVSDDPEEIVSADKIIFPGVGEAGSAMAYLRERHLDKLIPSLRQPVLGICLGMQLMCASSEESNTECMGIFDINVRRFNQNLKVPQIGWNNITRLKTGLFNSIPENEYMYLVHGFYAGLSEYTIATVDYGITYSGALQKGNFYAVQFHPEKSGAAGQKLIDNFLKL